MRARIILIAVFAILFFFSSVDARPPFQKAIQPTEIDESKVVVPVLRGGADPENITESPGVIVGTTYYEYQSNGACGNRIARDSLAGYHFCWTNGVGQVTGNRHVSYNFMDETGALAFGDVGTFVNPIQGAGFTSLDVFADGRGAVAYHNAGDLYLMLGIDAIRGAGLFTQSDIPDQYPGAPIAYWPCVAIDNQERIHITARANGAPELALYTRSDDGGNTWSGLSIIDTLGQVGVLVFTSYISDRAAIVYSLKTPGSEFATIGDIIYIESMDGTNWDFLDKHNITQYGDADTIRAWLDFDAVYDQNDSLHIIWNTPIYDGAGGISVASLLWHWSKATGISMIADAYWDAFSGAGNASTGKPTIGVDSRNYLYVVWTQMDTTDMSAGGYSNGELYGAGSTDGGLTWRGRVNLTNSPSDGCQPGDCDSDHWSSLAEVVDDSLHILYVNDKDAGAAVRTEGVGTDSPVKYLAFPVNLLVPLSVDDQVNNPGDFEVLRNYPNPFNSSTKIVFKIEKYSDAKLEVFNVVGGKIAVLAEGAFDAGEYSIDWDGSKYSSGIYFYKLTTDGVSKIRRMVLLK